MNFKELIENRYTTKVYDASKKITADKKEALQQILRLSPSSINSQPWRFTFVSDPATKAKLSEVSWINKDRVLNCDTVVVFSRIDSIEAFEKQIEAELPAGAVGYFKEFIKTKSTAEIKSWFDRQVYLSLGIFLSACASMGIDSTPMEGIEPEHYDSILNQENYAALAAVAIGYRDPEDFNQPSKKPKSRRNLAGVIRSI